MCATTTTIVIYSEQKATWKNASYSTQPAINTPVCTPAVSVGHVACAMIRMQKLSAAEYVDELHWKVTSNSTKKAANSIVLP